MDFISRTIVAGSIGKKTDIFLSDNDLVVFTTFDDPNEHSNILDEFHSVVGQGRYSHLFHNVHSKKYSIKF